MSDSDMDHAGDSSAARGGYDITRWSDFVRGVLTPENHREMAEALRNADTPTRKAVALLRRVQEVGRIDQEHEVPQWAVRCAYAAASLQRPAAQEVGESWLQRLRHHITFDSLLAPAPVGTREISSHHRRLLVESGSYSLDLRLERENQPPSTVVVGQLLDGSDPTRPPAPLVDVPVLVLDAGRVVERDRTTRFGEFQAEGLTGEHLELCVLITDTEFLQLPLNPATGEDHDRPEVPKESR